MDRCPTTRKVPILYIVVTILSFFVTFCGNGEQSTPQSGVNETALILISGNPDFPETLVNNSIERTFTLTNIGSKTASQLTANFFQVAFTFKGGSYPGDGGSCGTALSSSEGCSVIVVFSPKFPGPTQASLNVQYFNGIVSKSINDYVLSGKGI